MIGIETVNQLNNNNSGNFRAITRVFFLYRNCGNLRFVCVNITTILLAHDIYRYKTSKDWESCVIMGSIYFYMYIVSVVGVVTILFSLVLFWFYITLGPWEYNSLGPGVCLPRAPRTVDYHTLANNILIHILYIAFFHFLHMKINEVDIRCVD